MLYNFTLAVERPKIFLQSLLLADGALCLGGIWDILHGIDKQGVYGDDPTTMINVSGHVRLSVLDYRGHFKQSYDGKRQQYLSVLAMRAASMPGAIEAQEKVNVRKQEANKE